MIEADSRPRLQQAWVSTLRQLCNSVLIESKGVVQVTLMESLAAEAFTTWKQKKIQRKMFLQVGIEPGPLITSDAKSNTLLSGLTWHVLVRRSLNFCSCTTWFLDITDSVRINRVWLYIRNLSLSLTSKCQLSPERLTFACKTETQVPYIQSYSIDSNWISYVQKSSGAWTEI